MDGTNHVKWTKTEEKVAHNTDQRGEGGAGCLKRGWLMTKWRPGEFGWSWVRVRAGDRINGLKTTRSTRRCWGRRERKEQRHGSAWQVLHQWVAASENVPLWLQTGNSTTAHPDDGPSHLVCCVWMCEESIYSFWFVCPLQGFLAVRHAGKTSEEQHPDQMTKSSIWGHYNDPGFSCRAAHAEPMKSIPGWC